MEGCITLIYYCILPLLLPVPYIDVLIASTKSYCNYNGRLVLRLCTYYNYETAIRVLGSRVVPRLAGSLWYPNSSGVLRITKRQ